MRLFAAIDINRETAKAVRAAQQALYDAGPEIRWISPKRLHLTIKFYGETSEEKLPAICRALEDAATVDPFEMITGELGWFGSVGRPRVIWMGMADPSGKVCAMADRLAVRAVGEASNPAKDFVPHITIGRVKTTRGGRKLTSVLSSIKTNWTGISIAVNEIRLYQSILHPDGPVYRVVHRAHLKGVQDGR